MCLEGLLRRSRRVEFGGVLYADHVRFHPCHPYIERRACLYFQAVSPDYCCLILHLGNKGLCHVVVGVSVLKSVH